MHALTAQYLTATLLDEVIGIANSYRLSCNAALARPVSRPVYLQQLMESKLLRSGISKEEPPKSPAYTGWTQHMGVGRFAVLLYTENKRFTEELRTKLDQLRQLPASTLTITESTCDPRVISAHTYEHLRDTGELPTMVLSVSLNLPLATAHKLERRVVGI